MEIILSIIAVYIVWGAIQNLFEKYHQKVRDSIARKLLFNFDFQKEKSEIININTSFNFKYINKNEKKEDWSKFDEFVKNLK